MISFKDEINEIQSLLVNSSGSPQVHHSIWVSNGKLFYAFKGLDRRSLDFPCLE